ncbi:SUF system NifU family Fe-S cluster assembly protein [Acidiphilium sp. AL]|uniref:SUF system NifU family Fe-S cluster assembly protein n=1 Tax=Acidiphilium iwatense TaxID=768198 RepID=A0ABS9DVI3_9PROT|nr:MULTISPECIES: SUF system NifU family Fe-S cluster assembly protein [Acidiphilium]MCF3946744.1 SUF system NifU family Fe-S cluster assembly protein [Acidiphilium iwatense]MCU4158714.1 SUF system NifU family Fe-S cluster assembly protein [Acidiphilium sp. AL]
MQDVASIEDLYQNLIMERARAPCHAGSLAAFDAEAEGDNPMCGDRVHVRIRRDRNRIGALSHETRGCAICISAADLMGDAVIGKSQDEIGELADAFETMIATGNTPDRPDFADLRALSGVHTYRSRHRCATLPWQALRAALGKTEHRHG